MCRVFKGTHQFALHPRRAAGTDAVEGIGSGGDGHSSGNVGEICGGVGLHRAVNRWDIATTQWGSEDTG